MTDQEFSRYLNTNSRSLTFEEFNGQPGRCVRISVKIPAPVATVWEAISTQRGLRSFLGDIRGDLREGGSFAIRDNASGAIHECVPQREIFTDWDFAESHSTVRVRLTEEEDFTVVDLEIASPDTQDDHWNTYGPGATGVGWEMVLLGLQHYATTGESMDENTWIESGSAREAITHWADAWCDVHVSTGADDVAARKAADRTAAFYLGDS